MDDPSVLGFLTGANQLVMPATFSCFDQIAAVG